MSDTVSQPKSHLALKIALRAIINIVLTWYLATVLDEYLMITGGFFAYLAIGSLLTLLNLFIRPILNLLSIPLKLFTTILGIVIVNGVFLWLMYAIALRMDPAILTLDIEGGIGGWIVLALIFGLANWLQKLVLH